LHDAPERPRTLFATHYHELTDLAESKEHIRNYHFAVKEWRGDIIFLRSLLEGAASHSHGIHVARLAGMPGAVLERAKEILARLEASRDRIRVFHDTQSETAAPAQMALFGAGAADSRLRDELNQLDISTMTPMDAMNALHRLTEEAKK
jgi:DNA mismatch repair protein MutS